MFGQEVNDSKGDNVSLQTELVQDMIQTLLNKNVIGEEALSHLKEDHIKTYEPNMIMDLRHHQIRQDHKLNQAKSQIQLEARRLIQNEEQKEREQVKEFRLVNREILKFQRRLETEHKKLINDHNWHRCMTKKIWTVNSDETANPMIMVTTAKVTTDNSDSGKDLSQVELSDVRTLEVAEIHHEELECEQGNGKFIEVLIRKTPGRNELNNKVLSNLIKCNIKHQNRELSHPEKEYEIMNRVWIQWMKFVQQRKILSNRDSISPLHLDSMNQSVEKVVPFGDEGKTYNQLSDYNEYNETSVCNSGRKVEASEDKTDVCDENGDNYANEYFFRLFQQKQPNITLRRFFRKWRNWTLKKHELKHLKAERQEREQKVRNYIELIETKQKIVSTVKSKQSPDIKSSLITEVSDFSDSGSKVSASSKSKNYRENYTYRFQAQKTIIATQKSQIEDQKRIIEDLKSFQCRLEAEMFQRESNQNLKATLQNFDPRHKSKTVFVQRALSSDSGYKSFDHASDDNLLVLNNVDEQTGKKSVALEIVQRMERRNAERKQKWQAAQERRRRLEEEKLQRAKEEEEMKQRHEFEAKQKKIEELREKQRLEKIRAEEQIREREIFHQHCQIADESNRRRLLINSFRKLHYNVLTIKRDTFIAHENYKAKLRQRYFYIWRCNVKQTIATKISEAKVFYNHCLMRGAFRQIFKIYKDYIQKLQAADDMCDMKVQSKYFRRWYGITCQAYLDMQERMRIAIKFHDRRIVRSNFNQWKKLPKITFEERTREKRLRALRERVQELLPDYCPVPFDTED